MHRIQQTRYLCSSWLLRYVLKIISVLIHAIFLSLGSTKSGYFFLGHPVFDWKANSVQTLNQLQFPSTDSITMSPSNCYSKRDQTETPRTGTHETMAILWKDFSLWNEAAVHYHVQSREQNATPFRSVRHSSLSFFLFENNY